MISSSKNFLFLHWPKTGGTSVRDALLPHAQTRYRIAYAHPWFYPLRLAFPQKFNIGNRVQLITGLPPHAPLNAMENKFGREQLEPYFKFSFTRNPFTRTWSHFQHIRRINTHPLHSRPEGQTFGAYVNHLCQPGIQTQTNFTSWIGEKLPALDFCGCFERFKEDAAVLANILKTPRLARIKHLNKGTDVQKNSPDFRALFGDNLNRFIDHYRDDFDSFGYSCDPDKARLPAGNAPIPREKK